MRVQETACPLARLRSLTRAVRVRYARSPAPGSSERCEVGGLVHGGGVVVVQALEPGTPRRLRPCATLERPTRSRAAPRRTPRGRRRGSPDALGVAAPTCRACCRAPTRGTWCMSVAPASRCTRYRASARVGATGTSSTRRGLAASSPAPERERLRRQASSERPSTPCSRAHSPSTPTARRHARASCSSWIFLRIGSEGDQERGRRHPGVAGRSRRSSASAMSA
jgi:hypothetical protein